MARQQSQQNKRVVRTLIIGAIIIFTAGLSFKFLMKIETLPTPEEKCSVSVNWKGIVPGNSTRQDVINILGHPDKSSMKKFHDVTRIYYTYQVDHGLVADYAQDRIYFRFDGVVDWMEVVVADRDGSYHNVLESVQQFGNVLDVAYLNNNYDPTGKFQIDVLGGPDQLYVWSNCGVVLDTLPKCSLDILNDSSGSVPNDDLSSRNLIFRFPNPYQVGGEPNPDASNMVLMEILFPPTSYEAFTNSYMYKIPFGLWGDYVRELSCRE